MNSVQKDRTSQVNISNAVSKSFGDAQIVRQQVAKPSPFFNVSNAEEEKLIMDFKEWLKQEDANIDLYNYPEEALEMAWNAALKYSTRPKQCFEGGDPKTCECFDCYSGKELAKYKPKS